MKHRIFSLFLALLLLCGCAGKTNRLSEAYEVFGRKPSELGRIEMLRQSTLERKSAEDAGDLKKILRVFAALERLPGETPDAASFESSYVVQFYGTDGKLLLTASYAEKDKSAVLAAGGQLYAVKPAGMDKLWDSLSCEAVPTEDENVRGFSYLERSGDDLSARYGNDTVLCSLKAYADGSAAAELLEKKADSASADGFVLEDTGSAKDYPAAQDCEFWLRGQSAGVVCRVSGDDFQTYLAADGSGSAWTLYLKNGEVAAIEEAYAP